MTVGIIGQKLGMSQIFDIKGQMIPVTVIQAGPCPVIQKKVKDNEGYNAIQIGYSPAGRKKASKKPVKGHFQSANCEPLSVLKELKTDESANFNVGQMLTIDMFKKAELVKVTGLSKGRGFAGVMKRYGFAGKDSGHGSHEYFRHGGSIGCRTPKRVVKGMRMPGRMGMVRVSVKNLKIMLIDKENNLLLLKGAVPGWNGGYVLISKNK